MQITKKFVDALGRKNYIEAAAAMNEEVSIRSQMTPGVFDTMGRHLVTSAVNNNCGARFTGAGGGGCIWALGETDHINRLKPVWQELLAEKKEAGLLEVGIDVDGLKTDSEAMKELPANS